MSTAPYPRYSKKEFARRGDEIYEREVQPHLSAQDAGKFVAIDIETGAFETDADEIASKPQRIIGQDDGLFEIPDDFDAPLSAEVLVLFQS